MPVDSKTFDYWGPYEHELELSEDGKHVEILGQWDFHPYTTIVPIADMLTFLRKHSKIEEAPDG